MKKNAQEPWQNLLNLKFKKETYRDGMIGHNIVPIDKMIYSYELKNKFVIVGVPDDRGVALNLGNMGAKNGPDAFRQSFYRLYDCNLNLKSQNIEASHAETLGSLFVDVGDIKLVKTIQETHENLATVVEHILHLGAEIVFVIGGGHDFSFGSYKGHVKWSKESIIPIFNFDAHLDVRPVENQKINSGTAFWRIIQELGKRIAHGKALMEIGIQRSRNPQNLFDYCFEKKVTVIEYDPFLLALKNMSTGHAQKMLEHVRDHFDLCSQHGFKKEKGSVHLSFCLDVLNQFIAPGTSASTPFGLSLNDLIPIFSFFAHSSICRVVDIAELCPARDSNSQTARLVCAFVYHFAKVRQEFLSNIK